LAKQGAENSLFRRGEGNIGEQETEGQPSLWGAQENVNEKKAIGGVRKKILLWVRIRLGSL